MTDLDEYENKLDELPVTHASFPRVFRYFSEVLKFLPEGEDVPKYVSLFKHAMNTDRKSYALLIAIKLRDQKLIEEVYNSVEEDTPERRQMEFIMAATLTRIPVCFSYSAYSLVVHIAVGLSIK